MTGPLLKSGSLTAFHAVGAVGNPVYLAASQLRAAIARRLGADVADTFAIPQRNEDGDAVDWYAPRPGPVVPWSAASDSERAGAQQRLLKVRAQIEDLGHQMEAEASPERQVFGRLLAQVMSFPDDDDVHLVNGQPVLTFWGFVKDRAAVGSDPLRSLDMHLAEAQPTSQRRALPWWAWALIGLLLLLLLLLALFGLRGCDAPPTSADGTTPSSGLATRQLTGVEPASERAVDLTDAPIADPPMEQTTPVPESPIRANANRVSIDRDTRIDGGGPSQLDQLDQVDQLDADAIDATLLDGIDGDATLEGDVDNTALATDADTLIGDDAFPLESVDAAIAAEDLAPAAEPLPAEELAEAPVAPSAEEMSDADAAVDEIAEDLSDATGEASEDAATPEPDTPEAGTSEAANPDTAAPDAAESPQATSSDETASGIDPAAATAAGAEPDDPSTGGPPPVRIAPKRLLNSSWRTSTTLLDPKDGSPIHLDYRLKDGAGKLRLTRKDGSTCESGADAKVQDGRLLVDSAAEIVCADGTSFGRPRIDCTPRADGKARCVGRYPDGSTFPIDMQQQPD